MLWFQDDLLHVSSEGTQPERAHRIPAQQWVGVWAASLESEHWDGDSLFSPTTKSLVLLHKISTSFE